MPERDLQCDVAAVAVAEEVGLPEVQVPEQSNRVLGGLLEEKGRSTSAVWPCPCCSKAITCRVFETRGINLPNEVSMVEPPPWSNTSGTPSLAGLPWIS